MNQSETEGNGSLAEGPVMVVGARGFIGRHLVNALIADGIVPIAADRAMFDLSDIDATRAELARLAPAQVVNATRVGGHHPGGGKVERDAAETLLDAAREAGADRFVQLGSGLEYGSDAGDIDDETELRPDTEFGRGKADATDLVLEADGEGGTRTTVLRPFMVYGPGEPERRLITAAALAALEDRELALTAPGLHRNWVFVTDVADAIVAALGGGADGRQVNLAAAVDTSNEEIATLAAAAAGKPLRTATGRIPARPWDVSTQRVSTETAAELLGWRAATQLDEGIALTVAPVVRSWRDGTRVAVQ